MDDFFEEIVGGVLGVMLFVAVMTAAVLLISYVLIPVGVVGGGFLYWLNVIHLPEKAASRDAPPHR